MRAVIELKGDASSFTVIETLTASIPASAISSPVSIASRGKPEIFTPPAESSMANVLARPLHAVIRPAALVGHPPRSRDMAN